MDRDKLVARLRSTFVAELQEHVRVFNRELLALEQLRDPAATAESIRVLFRAAHSLKGASHSVSATKLEGACHQLEELLQGLRDGTRELTAEVIATLFAGADAIEVAGREFGGEALQPSAAQDAALAQPPSAARPEARTTPAAIAVPAHLTAALPAPAAPQSIPVAPSVPIVSSAHKSFPPPSAAREPANQNIGAQTLVRVPGRKLDGLLAQSGELLIARRRFDGRRGELAALQDFVASMRAEWRGADAFLKQLVDKAPDKSINANGSAHGNGKAPLASTDVVASALPRKAAQALQATREHLARLEKDLDGLLLGITEDMRTLERVAGCLEEQIHEVRMLPFSQACEGLFRAVRDLARTQNKDVELVLEGGDIELDRSIIDALRDPLLHIVRNAVDHGIESAERRSHTDKPARATIRVSVTLRADQAEIVVRDDGRGIDVDAVRATALRRNPTLSTEALEPERRIFDAGFSTASTITDVSGRGVGLDVVKTQVEAMRGSVEVASAPGKWTAFTLFVPLTVTTLRVLFVRVGGEVFALPSASVLRLVRAAASQVGVIEGREMLISDAAPVPIVSLAELLGSPAAAPPVLEGKLPLVLTRQQNQTVALAVDELLSEQDVVCKPLGERIGRMPHISAATVLPTGRVALLLKPSDLVRASVSRAPARRAAAGFAGVSASAAKRVLLVDDSPTTRTLERSILEAAGYEVLVAVDGSHAWQLLQETGADLVVSDVEMPNMDGFALTQAIRSSKRFRDLPMILLTSLDSAQDRARGMESGANAYLVKSAFDQANLLDTIRQLL